MSDMKNDRTHSSSIYQIKIKGQLSPNWSEWFSGLAISHDETGNTILSGDVKDQAALHGLLKRIRDTGVELISVNPMSNADDVTPNIE